MLILFLSIASSIKVTKIPESGNPPARLSGSSAVYDPIMNNYYNKKWLINNKKIYIKTNVININ